MHTPTRVGSVHSGPMPLSRTAKPAAPTANLLDRLMILADLRCSDGRKGVTSKSLTSPAIWTGKFEASKLRIGPTPLAPSRQADQKASLPTPFGATTPTPVTTTLRMALGSPVGAATPDAGP